jgi:uncharacterized protein (TIGR02600 family)
MHRRGFSLVIVLAALAIVSLLIIAMFSGVSHGLRFAQNDANLAHETMLADSAAALVIGQIEQATTPAGQAWISQPGLIRTYAAASSARAPAACYKLYSAPQMIDSSGGVAFLATDVPADWNSPANAGVYTDLNTPVQTLAGGAIYPILDAGAVTSVTGLSSDTGHAVEMPVAWLYELKDGSLGLPGAATTANPIVGRVAFWTDDETSKIDANTAGVASPWNTPRTSSVADTNDASTQPATGEFERYPGHPAGVSLDVLFGTNSAAALGNDALLSLTPRYSSGGSEFGTRATTAATSVPLKSDRLYGSVDELCFGAALNSSGQRMANPLTPAEVNQARFVLTAHSHAPETTLLGEPRVAIWPVGDGATAATQTTPADRAVSSDASLTNASGGSTDYFLLRHNAASATDDLDPGVMPGNATLFANLVATGAKQLPGYSGTFAQKYPGPQWPQIVVEMLDAIRGFNAVDPAAGALNAPTSFIPFAAGDSAGVGRGLIVPLATTVSGTTVRGLGRYPTLCGLTLVLYASGFGFSDGTAPVDFDSLSNADAATSWSADFLVTEPPNSHWSKVNSVLIRAFLVPTLFQPNCGFPEVSEACSLRISGLDALTASVKDTTGKVTTGNFGFQPVAISPPLSDALKFAVADRAWGGFEGPVACRATAADSTTTYAFAGTKAFTVPLAGNAQLDSKTGGPSMPASWKETLTTAIVNGLTVDILDNKGKTVQTLSVNLSAVSGQVPTCNGEADRFDTPADPHTDWTTNPACAAAPWYYMSLARRLQTTQRSRMLMIQAGDISYSVEARTDLRVIAALPNVPATLFGPATTTRTITTQNGTHQNTLRFADGTSACFCSTQATELASVAYVSTPLSLSVTDWRDGTTQIPYTYFSSPAAAAPTGSASVTMAPPGSSAVAPLGDWDTGPGFAPDGALANLPDAGTTLDPATAYASLGPGLFGAATRRSPNALVPSPVVFGSLPAGINPAQPAQSQPWRTLLFCPYPLSDQAHPGLTSPPDYLLLDRFWMPVVEPYAISTRFETAGKINLNDQIAPFTYLHRNTALHALLRGVQIPAISKAYAASYKTPAPSAKFTPWLSIDENATIAQIESRFANGDAYLTEGEICSVPLIPILPVGAVAQTPETFWTASGGGGYLTGDNLRELPYAELYSRLTTRSNSYTVHIRAQVLQKLNDHSNPAVWREGVDHVLGDWRGSYEIERYLDPAATAPAAGAALGPYKFRIVSAQRFTP